MKFWKRPTFSYDEIEAALCVWEYMLEIKSEQIDTYGTGVARSAAAQIGSIISEVWDLLANQGYEYNACFDWEFVPALYKLIDVDAVIQDNQYNGPAYEPNIASLAGKILMFDAELFTFTDPVERWL